MTALARVLRVRVARGRRTVASCPCCGQTSGPLMRHTLDRACVKPFLLRRFLAERFRPRPSAGRRWTM